jgi:hypothetical protein
MEMITIDTLGAMQRRGYGLFGWCGDCGAPSSYWTDVRRTPKRAIFDIDIAALIRERGADASIVSMPPTRCPRCGSCKTETRIMAPARPPQ